MFAVYAASAPRLDLQTYVQYAQRHRDEYGAITRAIVADMVSCLDTLTGSVAAQKRTVWILISRFKSSIPQWYGNAGSPNSTFDADAFQTAVALYVTRGAAGILVDPKTPVIEGHVVAPRVIESPVVTKATSWKVRALAAEAALALATRRLTAPSVPRRVNAAVVLSASALKRVATQQANRAAGLPSVRAMRAAKRAARQEAA